MSPQIATKNPAPVLGITSITSILNPSGLPNKFASSDNRCLIINGVLNEKEVIECKSVVKNNNIHSSDEDFAEKSDVVEVIVVQRKEYMKVTDYTVFSENAGIIGYNSNNSSSNVESIK